MPRSGAPPELISVLGASKKQVSAAPTQELFLSMIMSGPNEGTGSADLCGFIAH